MPHFTRRRLLAAGAGVLAVGSASVPAQAEDHRKHPVRHRRVRTNGITMHVAEAGAGPTVLLLHGFPELWYSWRHQLPALAEAGYHVVAPDLRGYGSTDAPADPRGYSLRSNLADLTGLLDALGVRTAAIVGHDQGSTFAWAGAQLHPDRFPAVVSLGVPYPARTPIPLTQMIRQASPHTFNVVLYFQQPGVAEAELNADPARTLRTTLYVLAGEAPDGLVDRWFFKTPAGSGYLDPLPDPGPPSAWSHWISDAEFSRYVRAYQRTRFDGAIRRYRTFDFDWSDLPTVGTVPVTQPTLFVAGELDSAYRFTGLEALYANVPGLRGTAILPGCGHWTQQERAQEVNRHLVDFLHAHYPPHR